MRRTRLCLPAPRNAQARPRSAQARSPELTPPPRPVPGALLVGSEVPLYGLGGLRGPTPGRCPPPLPRLKAVGPPPGLGLGLKRDPPERVKNPPGGLSLGFGLAPPREP